MLDNADAAAYNQCIELILIRGRRSPTANHSNKKSRGNL